MRSILVVLLTVIACTVLAAAGALVLRVTAPRYTARALLRVQPDGPARLTMEQPPHCSEEIMERVKRSEAEMVKHPEVLARAVDDPSITRTQWYEANKANAVKALGKAIDVGVVPETEFISVSMTSTRKDEVADIVNTVAQYAVEQSSEVSKRCRDDEIHRLQSQKNALSTQLDRMRRERSAAIAASPMAGMPERRNIIAIELDLLTRAVVEAQDRQSLAHAELKAFEEAVRQAPPAPPAGGAPATRPAAPVPKGSIEDQLRELERDIELPYIDTPPQAGAPPLLSIGAPATRPAAPAHAQGIEGPIRGRTKFTWSARGHLPMKRPPPAEGLPALSVGSGGEVPAKDTDRRLREVEQVLPRSEWLRGSTPVALARQGLLTAAQIAVARAARQHARDMATYRLVTLRERYDEARAKAKDLEITRERVRNLTEECDCLAEDIRKLEQPILALRLQQIAGGPTGEGVGRVSLRAQATPPLEPSQPRWTAVLAGGAAFGLVLGVVLALIFRPRRGRETGATPVSS